MMGLPEPIGETEKERNDNEHKNVLAKLKEVVPEVDCTGALWTHRRHHTSMTQPKPITLVFKKECGQKVVDIKEKLKGVTQNTLRPSLTPEERKRKKKAAEKWGELHEDRQKLDRDTAWRCPFL